MALTLPSVFHKGPFISCLDEPWTERSLCRFPPVGHRPYNCMVLGSSILSWESQPVSSAAVRKPAGASDWGQVQAGGINIVYFADGPGVLFC